MYYNFLIVHFYTHFYVIEIIVCARLYLMIHLILYHNQPYYVTKNTLLTSFDV